MRVLVTGATGFAGRHLVALLERRGHAVRGVSRSAREPGAVLRLPDERGSAEVLSRSRPEAVIHLAGISFVPDAEADPIQAAEVNVEGTLSLLKALQAWDPGGQASLVMVSTGQVYDARGGGKLTEDAPLAPPNVYSRTKLAAELLADAYARAAGRPTVIFRPFNHIGPGQREGFAISSFARQIARIERRLSEPVLEVGNLDARRDFCDVRDIAEAYRLAAEGKVPPGTYNLASGEAVSLERVVEILRALARSPFEVRVRQDRLRVDEAPILIGDAEKIRAAAGWKPSLPLETSIRDALDAWRAREDA